MLSGEVASIEKDSADVGSNSAQREGDPIHDLAMAPDQVGSHHDGRNEIGGADLVPSDLLQARRLLHEDGEAEAAQLESDKKYSESCEDRRLTFGGVEYRGEDEPNQNEGGVVEDGVHQDRRLNRRRRVEAEEALQLRS